MCCAVGTPLFFAVQILNTACDRSPRQRGVRLCDVQYYSDDFFGLQSTSIKVIDCVGAAERLRKSHHVHVSAKRPHQQFCVRSCFEAT